MSLSGSGFARPELSKQQECDAKTGSGADQPKKKGPRKPTPHGRGLLPNHLPVKTILVTPKGLPANARILGEDVSWRLGFQRASFYRLKIVRARYAVDADASVDCTEVVARMDTTLSIATHPAAEPRTPDTVTAETPCAADVADRDAAESGVELETTVVQASMPLEIIRRGLPTVDVLAHVIVGKFSDGLPFNRQSSMFRREGLHVTRSTMCQWTGQAHEMARHLVTAMANDARRHADVIATDATGVLVQANERCKKGCFSVYVSNNGHIIFRYSKSNGSDEPNDFLSGFKGTVLADATATLDALCRLPDVYRAGCQSHARRYFYKAIATDRDRGLVGLGLFNRLFELERGWANLPPDARLAERQRHARPVFDDLMGWCDAQLALVEERTPIRAALYLRDQQSRRPRTLPARRPGRHPQQPQRARIAPAGDRGFIVHLFFKCRKTGVRVVKTAVRAPDMNAVCERFLGSVRRECLDQMLVLGEGHLRSVLHEYVQFFNNCRPHQGLGQRAPASQKGRSCSRGGKIVAMPVLGGLHHDYQRAA